ncbi:MAG: aldo/keto reductase [Parvibaculaceae bacterium]
MRTRTFKAPSGASIKFTEMGFGTAPIGNLLRVVSEDDAQATLAAAWKAGMRYFDTAPLYGAGLAETRLNHFLRGKPRSRYIVSTKVGRLLEVSAPGERLGIGKFFDIPSRREIYDYSYDGVMRSLDFSLERLGLDSVEILFVHDIDVFNHGTVAARDAHVETLMASGYRALVKLRDEKVIKAFGAGVNEWEVAEILTRRGDFDMFLLAGRYTLLEQTALDSFLPLCEERGIGIVLGGPYNSGILATGARPGAYYNYARAPKRILDRVRRIEEICRRHRVKLPEAALRFPLAHPCVVSIIPGGVRPQEVRLNVKTLGASIPKALWRDLKAEELVDERAPVPR